MRKVTFDGDKQPYRVLAENGRYRVCVRPFNLRRTYTYTLVDMDKRERGACNMIFGPPFDFSTPEGASLALQQLESGELRLSQRNVKSISDRELEALK